MQVLLEAGGLIAVDKPSGLLSVPGRGPEKADCVVARLSRTRPWVREVHRLDRDTSGLMLLATDPDTHRAMTAAFADRRIKKGYVARVAGRPKACEGEVDLPLAADWPNRPRQKVDPETGRPARTRWRVLAREIDATRMALEPVTGRSHQLRVHMAAIGHPILGDPFYAPDCVAAAAPRLCLHAAHLSFVHPSTARRIDLYAPVPF